MSKLLKVTDLELAERQRIASPLWSASQFVEPKRDGHKWCDWDQAEEMLVLSAQSAMRGSEGVSAKGYLLSRDEENSVLTLELA